MKYACVAILIPVALLLAGCTALRPVHIDACKPSLYGYTFLWWAYGFECTPSVDKHVLCLQTGYYGMSIDAEKAQLISLGTLPCIYSRQKVLEQGNEIVFGLPKAAMTMMITAGGKSYHCIGAACPDPSNWHNVPYRWIDSGTFVQRFDILGLKFQADDESMLAAAGRLEVVAWPDRLVFILDMTPQKDRQDMSISLDVKQSGLNVVDRRNNPYTASIILAVKEQHQDDFSVNIVARHNNIALPVPVTHDAVRGWYAIPLPPLHKTFDGNDHPDTIHLTLTNPTGSEQPACLCFDANNCTPGGIGVICDIDGNPTDIQFQISKNWHNLLYKPMLYEGKWYHGFTILRLPPHSIVNCQVKMVYGWYNGRPAVSHSQLCLIGYGGNQLWHEVALGNWGESICYDPEVGLCLSMIDDMRPLMVRSFDPNNPRWYWTNNVGGGDFLVYYDAAGIRQPIISVKTLYSSYGPQQSDVTYSGVTRDGAIKATLRSATPQSSDYVRVFHHIRYDVLNPLKFSRIAFYQLGADKYNFTCSSMLAYGNENGLIEEWAAPKAVNQYYRHATACEGNVPWFSLHKTISTGPGAWANRGLIVRSWHARLNGKDINLPHFASYMTQNASANIELVPPAGVNELLAGDFVEMTLELIVIPQFGEDYYGPDQQLLDLFKSHPDSWQEVYREAKNCISIPAK